MYHTFNPIYNNMLTQSVLGYVQRTIRLLSQRRYTSSGVNNKIGIIGVPFDKGQRINTDRHEGPKAIRDGGLLEEIRFFNEWVDIKDYGDIQLGASNSKHPEPSNMRNYHEVISTMKNLSDQVSQILNEGRMCVTLGGDHSLGIGSVDGHLRYNPNTVVFWIDAHADLNTNMTSATGNMHGMPVALCAKETRKYWPKDLPGLEWLTPKISLKDFVYIGLRNVDPLEKLIAEKHQVTTYGMEEVDKYGITKIVEMALNKVDPKGEKGIHISFDIDSLDSLEVPSTGTPVRGGLTLREGSFLVEQLRKTGRLEAIDLVEVNPAIGTPSDVKKTVAAAIHILAAACGNVRGGNVPKSTDEIPTVATN